MCLARHAVSGLSHCSVSPIDGSRPTHWARSRALRAVRAQVYVAELDPVLNVRTLTDYDVKRFFTQFGATPLGVWSNPIGNWVEDKDDMELRNTYMYGLDVMFHRCDPTLERWPGRYPSSSVEAPHPVLELPRSAPRVATAVIADKLRQRSCTLCAPLSSCGDPSVTSSGDVALAPHIVSAVPVAIPQTTE